MKLHWRILALILFLFPVALTPPVVWAQTNDLTFVEPPKPLFGTFFSLQKWLDGEPDAPYPWNPTPDLGLYACTNCAAGYVWYFYDDRSSGRGYSMDIDYPPDPAGGGESGG